MRLILLSLLAFAVAAAQTCGKNDMQGAYGFQLSGATTISGARVPAASIGRLVLDGDGNVSGESSVNFKGLFLGNPVTGTYSFNSDCSLAFALQDDSGAWQHFRGTARTGGATVEIEQTDPGSAVRGTMQRTADNCAASQVRGTYMFTMSAAATPLAQPGTPDYLSVKGTAEADGAGNLKIAAGKTQTAGTYTMQDGCFAQLELTVPAGEDSAITATLRGIVVHDGREILAVQTNPQQTATARFSLAPSPGR